MPIIWQQLSPANMLAQELETVEQGVWKESYVCRQRSLVALNLSWNGLGEKKKIGVVPCWEPLLPREIDDETGKSSLLYREKRKKEQEKRWDDEKKL